MCLLQAEIFLEVAIPEILSCIDWPIPEPFGAERIEGIVDWLRRKRFWQKPHTKSVLSGQYDSVHPVKLSKLLGPNEPDGRKVFCQEIMPKLYLKDDQSL